LDNVGEEFSAGIKPCSNPMVYASILNAANSSGIRMRMFIAILQAGSSMNVTKEHANAE
jgi:hypothetical protein